MMRKILGLMILALTSAPPAFAAEWVMRERESSIGITARQQGAEFAGAFTKFSTGIKFDPADLAGSQVVAKIDTGSFDSKSPDRDGQVRGSDWFHVAKFPEAAFLTKSFRALGNGKYEAIADLRIRDVTREVVLPFTLAIDGTVARMAGEMVLKRTDYGVGQGDWADGAFVGLDVKVKVNIVADRKP